MKLAIIDLDGVVADNTARFAKAEEAKQAFITQKTAEKIERFHRTEIGWSSETVEKQAANLYWQTAFTPELVSLDTLIDGVNEALLELQYTHGHKLILLTSRPESMREATMEWLYQHIDISLLFKLFMKAPAFQYTKTTVWKAGMVQTLEALYGATDLLIIDDEQANINEHLKYFSNIQTREICKSLPEAVAKLNGTWVEPDPFLPED